MILGITCTVIISLIALYQTWSARCYRQAADIYAATLENWKQAHAEQREQMKLASRRYEELAKVARELAATKSRLRRLQ